jgi:hypothetical protein
MKVIRATMDSQVAFILAGLDPRLHQAALDLHYQSVANGFAKYYPADTPHLDRVFLNLEQYAEAMLQQKAGFRPVPWQKALLAFLQVVEGEKLTWWLRGSAALAVRGLDIAPVPPLDLQLAVSERRGLTERAALIREAIVTADGSHQR